MSNQREIELGGKTYVIRPQSHKVSRQWRKKAAGPLAEVAGVLSAQEDIDLQDPRVWPELIDIAVRNVVHLPDILVELVFDYSPELRQDQEHLEDNCTDAELMSAFQAVIEMAYPFGQIIKMFPGQSTDTTK